MALMDILNAIGGGLSSAGRGIGKGFSVVGKTLADPFYESEEERLARELGGADFGPTAATGLTGNYSPNFKKKNNFWDVLGDIGETTGRVATQVGRQLPILGPYVQAGEYGILKGLGKEDSDWAKGNIFAEREQAYEELQKQREFAEQERQNKLLQFPLDLESKRTGIEADKAAISESELLRQKTQIEINDLLAKRRAAVLKYGSEDNAYVAEIDAKLRENEKSMLLLDARIASENAQRTMYETRGNEGQPLMTMMELEQNAREYANKASEFDTSPGAWQKAYTEYKTRNQWMLTGKSADLNKPITPVVGDTNPLSMVGIGGGNASWLNAPNAKMGTVDSASPEISPDEMLKLDRILDATDIETASRMIESDASMAPTERQKYLRYIQKKRAENDLRSLTPTF